MMGAFDGRTWFGFGGGREGRRARIRHGSRSGYRQSQEEDPRLALTGQQVAAADLLETIQNWLRSSAIASDRALEAFDVVRGSLDDPTGFPTTVGITYDLELDRFVSSSASLPIPLQQFQNPFTAPYSPYVEPPDALANPPQGPPEDWMPFQSPDFQDILPLEGMGSLPWDHLSFDAPMFDPWDDETPQPPPEPPKEDDPEGDGSHSDNPNVAPSNENEDIDRAPSDDPGAFGASAFSNGPFMPWVPRVLLIPYIVVYRDSR